MPAHRVGPVVKPADYQAHDGWLVTCTLCAGQAMPLAAPATPPAAPTAGNEKTPLWQTHLLRAAGYAMIEGLFAQCGVDARLGSRHQQRACAWQAPSLGRGASELLQSMSLQGLPASQAKQLRSLLLQGLAGQQHAHGASGSQSAAASLTPRHADADATPPGMQNPEVLSRN